MKKLLLFSLIPALFLPALLAQEPEKERLRPIKDVLPDARKIEGLFTFYQKKDRLLAEIKGSNLNTDYLIAMAVAKGSGTNPIGGYTYQANGSDFLWQFRKVNDSIQVVRKNIRYKADSGTPEAQAVAVGFSDSILYSLPILAAGEGGGDVIDLASIFMADLPRLGIGSFDRSRSTWGEVKGFPDNMEFRVAATYSGRSPAAPDQNAVGVTLHYSISRLPSSGYSPRIADPRIGYFTVGHKNFSRATEDNHMIRYITRWNLQKADSSSSPRKPIVFYIEKTVPFKYRNAVREGILEWNKAFERIGIVGAIEVRQQLDSDNWDSEDIRYNTIRWITSERGFAMGPSRVNPITGEILDADIIIDASWITHWRERFDYQIADVLPESDKNEANPSNPEERDYYNDTIIRPGEYAQARAAHFALASLALALDDDKEEKKEEKAKEEKKPEEEKSDEGKNEEEKSEEKKEDVKEEDKEKENGGKEEKKEEPKKRSRQELAKEREEKFEALVLAGLKDVVTHEVGHTLGLRHNFQASSWLTLDEINAPNRSKEYGHANSVMDYLPINIAPKGKPQGDYFMSGLGPYDYLAIEYGYKPIGSTEGERKDLAKIASKQAESGYNYSPDEDMPYTDPRTGTYDLGKHPLEFAQWRLELYNQLLPEILDRAIREDGRYKDVGRFYSLLISLRQQDISFVMRNLTGLYRHRDRKGDPGDRPPIEIVDAKTKRESVQFVCDNTFGADAFKIAPEIYNRFGTERWLSSDFETEQTSTIASLNNTISIIQCNTLSSLMSSTVLNALSDTELRTPEGEDVYVISELFETLTAAVFGELDTIKDGGEFSARKPAIPARRQALQEHYFKLLAAYSTGDNISFVLGPDVNASRALSRHELRKIESKIKAVQDGKANLDVLTKVHLEMLMDRLIKLREASVSVMSP